MKKNIGDYDSTSEYSSSEFEQEKPSSGDTVDEDGIRVGPDGIRFGPDGSMSASIYVNNIKDAFSFSIFSDTDVLVLF